ncbi:MAG TPA: glycosyltransferase family 39 protein [Candidatus Saccharimonadales bacterium]|nr:glycosyltransferase family 39 protein [Candidatus Saccharimonadales bacterium]
MYEISNKIIHYRYILLLLIVLLAGFLRIYKIDVNPPGLYLDEASIGYNAYKVLTTGKDEYSVPHPVFFKAFGEYKLPLYIYSVAASMKVFGKTEVAVRLPSAIAGSLTVLALYFFVEKLLSTKKGKKKNILTQKKEYVALLSSFVLSITPWHLQFSRGGFEATLALFFFLVGLTFFLYFAERKNIAILFFSVFFVILAMYAYFAYRVITPFTLFYMMGYLFWQERQWKNVLFVFIIAFVLSLPMIQFSLTDAGQRRFSQTSTFTQHQKISTTRKLTVYPAVYVKNFISFYSMQFLFISGDGIGRHQIPNFGLLYIWELPFLIFGIYVCLKNSNKNSILLFYLLFLAAVPGSLAQPSPHSLRFLLAVIPCTIFVSCSMMYLFFLSKGKIRKILIVCFLLCAVYEVLSYFHFYYIHYPKNNSLDWGAGYKETIQKIGQYKNKYKYIVIDQSLGDSDIYVKFYDETIHPEYVSITWVPPMNLDKKQILWVRNAAIRAHGKLIDTVYFKNLNKDPFAKFWTLYE